MFRSYIRPRPAAGPLPDHRLWRGKITGGLYIKDMASGTFTLIANGDKPNGIEGYKFGLDGTLLEPFYGEVTLVQE